MAKTEQDPIVIVGTARTAIGGFQAAALMMPALIVFSGAAFDPAAPSFPDGAT